MPIGILKLYIVSRISLVDGEDQQHVLVVLLQEGSLAAVIPVARRRADGVNTAGLRVQWRGLVQKRNGKATLELRHLDHGAAVRLRQTQDIVFCDEVLD